MPETSREFVVSLLDETTFTVPVKPTLLGNELLDMAASHMKVKEKEYFGLYTIGDGFKNWLELDKPVLDPSQDIVKGSQPVKVYFSFKYFVDDTHTLQDHMTVELLYLQSRQAVMKGEIITDEATLFELAACAMQAQYGDYRSEQEAKQQLNHLPVLPAVIFKGQSVQYCEAEVIHYYRMMRTLSRGEAIFKYLEIILTLPMYSVHYFEVKDKRDTALWLGVGPVGICQCRHDDRNEPDLRFQWLQLQNIYYRDRKFSMEVYQSAKPNKKGVGFGPVSVHAWYASNSKVVMAIWKMARDQHMFYRSKRTNRSVHGMNVTDIIRQLNKLHRSNISPSSSHSSLSVESAKSNQTQASAEAVAAAKAAQQEMYTALLAKRVHLVQDFEKKAARYKEILIKEMQITGIPPEGLTAEEIEKMRKKFGVSFKFSKFVLDASFADVNEVEQLEKELEVQSSIIEASRTLLGQANSRKLKKDRKKEIKEMETRYQRLEEKLQDVKRSSRSSTSSGSSSKFHIDSPTSSVLTIPGSVPAMRRRSGTPGGASIDDTFLANMIFDTPTKSSNQNSSLQKSPHHKSTSALNDVQTAPTSTQPFTHQPVTAAPSHTYTPHNPPHHKQSVSSTKSDRSLGMSEYTESPSYLSTLGGFADEFDSSPTSSVVSGQSNVFSGPKGQQGQRHSNQGLREFDLTEDFLQHFSMKDGGSNKRDNRTPNPSEPGLPKNTSSPAFSSPSKPGSHLVDIPATSSPVTRYKRASSPVIQFPTESKSGHRSSSPTPYLPEPDLTPYSSSYHPPSNLHHHPHHPPHSHRPHNEGALYPNPPQVNNTSPHPSRQAPGLKQGQELMYDNETALRLGANSSNHGPGESGSKIPVPVGSKIPVPVGSKIPVPVGAGPPRMGRNPSDNPESYDLHEMLKIWAESSKNPFGEGTLV